MVWGASPWGRAIPYGRRGSGQMGILFEPTGSRDVKHYLPAGLYNR